MGNGYCPSPPGALLTYPYANPAPPWESPDYPYHPETKGLVGGIAQGLGCLF